MRTVRVRRVRDIAGQGSDSGLLSTGTGALLFLGALWLATEYAHRRLR